ncbi:magnesium and cobalt efflux protein CorC [methanotrophic bacterial endosymbiont of Bathymodiolus sp.]|nr:magnesium and cobalt efflux protein CorC [methanotrophic bacterial endosymbiont of Bathymodiolus sp.]
MERIGQIMGGEPQDREDLLEILREAEEKHLLDKYALKMLEGVLQVSEQRARDVMVPRKKMIVIKKDASLEEVYPVVIEYGHSRFPVISEDKSEVVGILLAKDLLVHALDRKNIKVEALMRTATVVPESKRLNVLLKEFRAKRSHMAIVVDEYGAVAGVVTIEDVLEQIVGEIEDEHDYAEEEYITKRSDKEYIIQALTPLEDFNEYFSVDFDTEEFDTIGGFIVGRLEHMPKKGEKVKQDRFRFEVLRADGRRVHLLKLKIQDKK